MQAATWLLLLRFAITTTCCCTMQRTNLLLLHNAMRQTEPAEHCNTKASQMCLGIHTTHMPLL
jgi:hypothetical protein